MVARWAAGGPLGDPETAAAHAEQAIALATEMSLPASDPVYEMRDVGLSTLRSLGGRARDRGDYRRAAEAFDRAAVLVAPDPLPPADRARHARALLEVGRIAEAGRAVADLVIAPDPWVRAEALLVAGETYRLAGAAERAADTWRSVLALAHEHGFDEQYGEALRRLGLLDYLMGRFRRAEEHFAEALSLAERIGDERGRGWALQNITWSATTRGDFGTAEDALAKAGKVFTALGDSAGLAWCAGTEGFVRLLAGRLCEARKLCSSLLPRAEELGDYWGAAALRTIDALAGAELGDIEVAEREATIAVGSFEGLRDTWGEAMALIACGVAARGAGAPKRAVKPLVRAVEMGRREHPLTAVLALTVLGYCHLDARSPARAEKAAREAAKLLATMDLEPAARVGPTVLLAQARRTRGAVDEALGLLAEVAEAADEPSLLFPRRQALAHYSGTLLSAGRPAEALEWARRALDVPAQDVRSQVVALRAVANALMATGDLDEALSTVDEALTLAGATEQRSEFGATERAAARIRSVADRGARR